MESIHRWAQSQREDKRDRGILHRWGICTHIPSSTLVAPGYGGASYLSYLLWRSFSICGSTVVHRSSFHRELERKLGVMPSASPDHPNLLFLRLLTLSG